MIGRLSSEPFVEKVKNGEAKALFAQVELPNGEIRSIQIFPGAGDETWPCKGDVVVVERKGGLLYASALWDMAEPRRNPGEREIYSRNGGGTKQARHIFRDDGRHYIGNTAINLYKVLLDITDIIKNLHTKGAPGAHTVLESDQAKVALIEADIEKLLTKEA